MLDFQRAALSNLGPAGMLRRIWTKRVGTGLMELTSRHARYPVYARRNSSDLMVFNQIYIEREYSCLDDVRGVKSVFDLGANCGYASSYFLSRYPAARVVAVEPDPGNYAMLRKNTVAFGDRITCHEGAVWSSCTTLNFAEGTTDDGQEWERQTQPSATGGNIQAWDIPTLMANSGIETIDILKIDVEGAETAVFAPENDLSWLRSVRNIVIELHGPDCDLAFFSAIKALPLRISTCGELTVCLGD